MLELDILNKMGQELSSATTQGTEELLQVIFKQTNQLLMGTDDLFVAFYDKANDSVSFPFVVEKGQLKPPEGDWAPRKAGRGLTEYVIKHPKPLLIDNMDGWMDEHKSDVEAIGLPAKCWLGAPIIFGDEVIGVIAVQNHDREDFYGNDKLSVLATIAIQAGIAITNARLFERRILEFDALADVDEAITTKDLDTVLQGVLGAVKKIVEAPHSSVMLVDDSGQYLEVRAFLGESWPEGIDKRFKIGEHGIVGSVAKRRRSELVRDVNDPKWKKKYIAVLPHTQSELATPLLDEKGTLRGVINLESPVRERSTHTTSGYWRLWQDARC